MFAFTMKNFPKYGIMKLMVTQTLAGVSHWPVSPLVALASCISRILCLLTIILSYSTIWERLPSVPEESLPTKSENIIKRRRMPRNITKWSPSIPLHICSTCKFIKFCMFFHSRILWDFQVKWMCRKMWLENDSPQVFYVSKSERMKAMRSWSHSYTERKGVSIISWRKYGSGPDNWFSCTWLFP